MSKRVAILFFVMTLVSGLLFVAGNLASFRDETQFVLLGYLRLFSLLDTAAFMACAALHAVRSLAAKTRFSAAALLGYLAFALLGAVFATVAGIVRALSEGGRL